MVSSFPVHGSRERPLRPGCSISRLDHEAGTLTAVVTKVYEPNRRFALSCEHVLFPLSKQYSANVCQPADSDSLGLGEYDVVASGIEPAGMDLNTANEIDAAIVRLDPAIQSDAFVMNTDVYLGSIAPASTAIKGAKIIMVGRSSGVQEGDLLDPDDAASIVHGGPGYEREVEFEGIASATYDSDPGDSGAPVILADSGALIGMHIGSDSRTNTAFFAYVDKVFDHFQIVLA